MSVDWELADAIEKCPCCTGPVYIFGRLGNREWLQCRYCGWEYSYEIEEGES